MKAKLIGIYLVIGVIFGSGAWLFGENSHRGYAYNLGTGLVWPIVMLKSYPEFDGSSRELYGQSYAEVMRSHPNDMEGQILFNEALGLLGYYYYAQANESVNMENYKSISETGKIDKAYFKQIFENPSLSEKIQDYTDGMTFGDLISDRDDIEEDLMDLLEERT